ncbi:MAG: TPR repeat- and protein kinase domain-containing [Planctomycetota bacterium]|nr:MAG: TPR repeat- and protein kinase domain-containing [Planctomycetota bacterium]
MSRRLAGLRMIALAAVLNSAAHAEEPTAAELVVRGKALLKKHEDEAAEQTFSRALKLDPKCVDAWVGRAEARRWDKAEEGIADYGEALKLAPGRADIWAARGQLRAWKGDKEGGLEDLAEAVKQDPANAEIRMKRSKILQEKGDVAAAVSEMTAAIERNPADLKLRSIRGVLRLDAMEFEGAAEDLTAAIPAGRTDLKILGVRGFARFGAGDWKKAAEDLDASIAADKSREATSGSDLALLFVAQTRAGMSAEAAKTFAARKGGLLPGDGHYTDVAFYVAGWVTEEDLLEDCWTDYEPHRLMGIAHASFFIGIKRALAGEPASAAYWLKRALAQDVSKTGRFKEACLANAELKRLGDVKAAASSKDEALWSRTENVWALLDRLNEVLEARDDAAREKAIADVLAVSPHCAEALSTRSIYGNQDKPERAMKDLDLILEHRPGNRSALRQRKDWRTRTGDYRGALEDARRTAGMRGNGLGEHSDCGDLLYVLGDLEEARAEYTMEMEGVKYEPRTDEMRVRLWIVSVAQGKGKAATEELAGQYKDVQADLSFETEQARFAAGLTDRTAFATAVDKFMAANPPASTHTWVHAFHLMGVRALYEGNKAEAIRMFENCRKREAREWMPWIASGLALEQLKKK